MGYWVKLAPDCPTILYQAIVLSLVIFLEEMMTSDILPYVIKILFSTISMSKNFEFLASCTVVKFRLK
jgi:hypothetical protein